MKYWADVRRPIKIGQFYWPTVLPNKICPCDMKNCRIFYRATFVGPIGAWAIFVGQQTWDAALWLVVDVNKDGGRFVYWNSTISHDNWEQECQTHGIITKRVSMGGNAITSVCLSVHFYRATLCQHGTSCRRVSVCLSVTRRYCIKTDKRRIMQTTSHNSPATLVFWYQRSWRKSTGVTPNEGA